MFLIPIHHPWRQQVRSCCGNRYIKSSTFHILQIKLKVASVFISEMSFIKFILTMIKNANNGYCVYIIWSPADCILTINEHGKKDFVLRGKPSHLLSRAAVQTLSLSGTKKKKKKKKKCNHLLQVLNMILASLF